MKKMSKMCIYSNISDYSHFKPKHKLQKTKLEWYRSELLMELKRHKFRTISPPKPSACVSIDSFGLTSETKGKELFNSEGKQSRNKHHYLSVCILGMFFQLTL